MGFLFEKPFQGLYTLAEIMRVRMYEYVFIIMFFIFHMNSLLENIPNKVHISAVRVGLKIRKSVKEYTT